MDSRHIDLNGSQIESITADASALRIAFSSAVIIKNMTGSRERTRWWQAGVLVLTGVQDHSSLPTNPVRCMGGEINENVYTYRDMLPIPFASRGHIRCILRFEGVADPFVAEATSANLELEGTPNYVEHLR